MKNKKLIATLSVIATIAYFGSDTNVEIRTIKVPQKNISKSIPKTEKSVPQEVVLVDRKPDSIAEEIYPPVKTLNLKKERPQRREYEGSHHVSLPSSFVVTTSVYTVKKDKFEPSMGKVIEERSGFVFFEAASRPADADPVIADSKSGKLYAISSVIKLNDVDNALRNELIHKGFQEHYYSKELKTLFVQSSQDEVFETFDELASLNLNPKVELLRNFHRPK